MKKILTLSIGLLLLSGAAQAQADIAVHDTAWSGYDLETYYDGTRAYTRALLSRVLGFSGLATGDTLAYDVDYTISSAQFADATAGTSKQITIVVALKGSAAAKYRLTNGNPYTVLVATVHRRQLSVVGGSVETKFYDGTTAAVVDSVAFSGLLPDDALVSGQDYTATATFADAAVGSGKAVTVTVTLAGTTESSYALTNAVCSDRVTGSIVATNYTVVYHGNGATGDDTTASSAHVYEAEKKLTSNGFSRAGYTFAGWATTPNGAMVYNDEASVKNLIPNDNGIFMLYAVWTANTYTVSYNANGDGGTGATASSTHVYGTPTALTPNGFSRAGYTFAGWSTTSDGEKEYDDNQPVSTLTTTDGGTVPLYAVWTGISYTVSYNANGDGGSGATATSTHVYGTPTELTPNGFSRTGYTFSGWSTTSGGAKEYDDNQPVSTLTTTAGETVPLYAVWEAAFYTITYHLNGGKNHANNPDTFTVSTPTIHLQPATLMGDSIFAGWYGNEALAGDPVLSIPQGSAGSVELWAKWEYFRYCEGIPNINCPSYPGYNEKGGGGADDDDDGTPNRDDPDHEACHQPGGSCIDDDDMCLVLFDANGGRGSSAKMIGKGSTMAPPAKDPTREGYTFEGWYRDEACTNVWDFDTPVTEDVTLYAKWADGAFRYAVTFVVNDGDSIPPLEVKPGEKLPYIKHPNRENYDFKGWYKDSVFTFLWDANRHYMDDGDMTLYACWELDRDEPWMDSVAVLHDSGRIDTLLQHGETDTTAEARRSFRYVLACNDTTKTLRVALRLPSGLTSNLPGDTLTLDSLKPAFSIDTTVILSTSHTKKEKKAIYTITLERKFPFNSIVHTQLGDRLLMVVNNPKHNGGYHFSRAWWRANSGAWGDLSTSSGTRQMYYVDPNGAPITNTMSVRLQDGLTGWLLETCPSTPRAAPDDPNAASASVYPNPVAAGGVVHLRAAGGRTAALPAEHPAARYDAYRLLDVQGRLQRSGSA
ncbi:MAG: InlB B-repeat-containing protein, partial [Prevotellaceae bacterium]|nr:InlB B-repeat-containing protein [Prevotellaceae bacterium]